MVFQVHLRTYSGRLPATALSAVSNELLVNGRGWRVSVDEAWPARHLRRLRVDTPSAISERLMARTLLRALFKAAPKLRNVSLLVDFNNGYVAKR